jgi:hypothetical protein
LLLFGDVGLSVVGYRFHAIALRGIEQPAIAGKFSRISATLRGFQKIIIPGSTQRNFGPVSFVFTAVGPSPLPVGDVGFLVRPDAGF